MESFSIRLPEQAKRNGWPKLIFLASTLHRNYNDYGDRKAFNLALDTVCAKHNDVLPLRLLQIWNENDTNLYSATEQRYIAAGLPKLWAAIDRTIAFCSKKMSRDELRYENTQLKGAGEGNIPPVKPNNNNTKMRKQQDKPRPEKIFWNRKGHASDEERRGGRQYRRLPNPYH